MKTFAFFLVALAMSLSAFGQTSPPAAPTLTRGAEFKGLRFDWNRVPGATWYQLEYRAHQNGAFVQQGDDFPATATSTHFSFPLHLFDWTYARYRLAACNSTGCSRSAEVSVSELRRDAVGYFKAATPVIGAWFGASSALSSDGYNMVAAAPFEVTRSAGMSQGGAVYVFRRGSDGKWFQRARLDAGATAYTEEGMVLNVAMSASGNTVAVAMPSFIVPGDLDERGEVDVYHFANNAWTRTRIPRLPASTFGFSAALSDAGDVLAIMLRDGQNSMAIYRSVNGAWTHVRDLSVTSLGYFELCAQPVMSRDGKVIAERCDDLGSSSRPRRDYIRVHSGDNWSVRTDIDLAFPISNDTVYGHAGFAIDGTGDTIAVQFGQSLNGVEDGVGFVKVFKRNNGAYSQVATFNPGTWRNGTYRFVYGESIAISGDGHTMAVGDPGDNGTGWGPRAAPLVRGTEQTGAVYVYRLTDSWRLANMVKPNYNPHPNASHIFGESTALSTSGKTLIVAAARESSSAQGIDGDWANQNLGSSGAIFMY